MINPNEIPAVERLLPLFKEIQEELTILDAERQRREARVKTLLNELGLAIAEVIKL